MSDTKFKYSVACYHCGADTKSVLWLEDKAFCCRGCLSVYELLQQNSLCSYYNFQQHPGSMQSTREHEEQYRVLELAEVEEKLIHFRNDKESHVIFYIPSMHCSACIYLLEHLQKLHQGFISSRVNFNHKEVHIIYKHAQLNLKEIAGLLHQIGYAPHISMVDESPPDKKSDYNRKQYVKIGIAGFCFGNIMMLSFPEYFHIHAFTGTGNFLLLFNLLSFLLSLPVLLFSAREFFISAVDSLKQRYLHIDVPIALAILITFLRSIWDIVLMQGTGYFDSMTGIVFFMLLGRFYQHKTYHHLSFERDYKSYFPLGVTVLNDNANGERVEEVMPVSKLKIGMRLLIRQHELIPADAILFRGEGLIDYSFVSGESAPVSKGLGELVYAGGKQQGGAIELELMKEVSQSYLTSLWNNTHDAEPLKTNGKSTDAVEYLNKYFSYTLLALSILALLYWSFSDFSRGFDACTTILIVACPCALLLSETFTYGHVLSLLAKKDFYVKNAKTVEHMAKADTVVFDKTGTITNNKEVNIQWVGKHLNERVSCLIASLANQSIHPLSKRVKSYLVCEHLFEVNNLEENTGRGISGIVDGVFIKIGSASFTRGTRFVGEAHQTAVYVSIDHEFTGYFVFANIYREGMGQLFSQLHADAYELHFISGDHSGEFASLSRLSHQKQHIYFNQKPEDKLAYLKLLGEQGKKAIMIGDGLNDAGALSNSYAGIAITDDINYFTPASSAILHGSQLFQLPGFLRFCKSAWLIIRISFVLSLLYNIVGLSYALSGQLKPVIAAILMPASTISIIVFTTVATKVAFSRYVAKQQMP